jgi:hypothetical protein
MHATIIIFWEWDKIIETGTCYCPLCRPWYYFLFLQLYLISTYFINVGYLEGKFSGTISGTNNDSKIRLSTNRIWMHCVKSMVRLLNCLLEYNIYFIKALFYRKKSWLHFTLNKYIFPHLFIIYNFLKQIQSPSIQCFHILTYV